MTSNSFPRIIFVSGTGTGIGKTVVSAIITEALQADYWKPVQAGFDEGTDSDWIQRVITNQQTKIHKEAYKLHMPASPHIASKKEDIVIDLNTIVSSLPVTRNILVVEGAGGLMVPLNDNEFVADLIIALNAPVILVSRNELGSINHSLLTAGMCKERNIKVLGWIFNDAYLDYENDIERWTNIPRIASIPFEKNPGREFVYEQANRIRNKLISLQ